jgi:hypothetical protein
MLHKLNRSLANISLALIHLKTFQYKRALQFIITASIWTLAFTQLTGWEMNLFFYPSE